jgi:protein SCO1/2
MPRSRLLLAAAIAVPILLLASTAALVAVRRAPPPAPPPLAIGAHFSLTTANGSAVTERSYRGKWLLVYFGYTFCPDACPTALSAIAAALERLGPLADRVQPLFVTVDPERDTPAVVADYVRAFDPRIIGLIGTPEQTAAAAREFRVYYVARKLGDDEYAIDHSSFLYLINPQGEFVRLLTGDLPGHSLADALRPLLE